MKNITYQLVVLFFCCIGFCQFASSQNTATKPTIEKIELLVDDSQKLTIEDVQKAKGFKEIRNGYSTPNKIANYWFRIKIKGKEIRGKYLSINSGMHFDLRIFQNRCGIKFGYFNRKNITHKDANPYLKIKQLTNGTYIYLCGSSKASVENYFFDILNERELIHDQQKRQFIFGVFYGILLLILSINIFYYFTIKEKAFLFYAAYILLTIQFCSTVDGIPLLGLFNLVGNYHLVINFSSILLYFGFLPLMSIYYVQIDFLKKYRRLALGYLIFTLISSLSVLVNNSNKYLEFSFLYHNITILFGIIFTLIIAIKGFKMGKVLGKFFMFGIVILLLFWLFTALEDFAITSFKLYFDLAKLGSLLEITILSFGLSLYFKNLKQDLSVKSVELDSLSHDYEEKEKEYSSLEDRFLSNQMNPHFTFNAMNSIQQYILENEPMKAQNYLTKYSKLIRKVLENTMEPYVSLEDEIQLLQLYLEIERMRFKFPFEIEINVDGGLQNRSDLSVPPMIVQPYIENALWHGLLHKTDASGKISLNFSMVENRIKCVIEDNGPGREYTRRLPKEAKEHRSVGMLITQKRLEHLHRSTALEVSHEIIDLQDDQGNPCGTRVEILLPLKK